MPSWAATPPTTASEELLPLSLAGRGGRGRGSPNKPAQRKQKGHGRRSIAHGLAPPKRLYRRRGHRGSGSKRERGSLARNPRAHGHRPVTGLGAYLTNRRFDTRRALLSMRFRAPSVGVSRIQGCAPGGSRVGSQCFQLLLDANMPGYDLICVSCSPLSRASARIPRGPHARQSGRGRTLDRF